MAQPRYEYTPVLSLYENELVAAGIATCDNFNEFLEYYRKMSEQFRPTESGPKAQKRAARLWKHIKNWRAASLAQNVCPVCAEAKEAVDDDGHCSYECATGGGFSTLRRRGVPEDALSDEENGIKTPEEEDDDDDLSVVLVVCLICIGVGYWLAMMYSSVKWEG